MCISQTNVGLGSAVQVSRKATNGIGSRGTQTDPKWNLTNRKQYLALTVYCPSVDLVNVFSRRTKT